MNEGAEKTHLAVMRAVLDTVGREHLLLKGGTALMFGYGIDRTSRDLDFDSDRPVRNIEHKLADVHVDGVTITGVDTLKNTATVTRYRLMYESPEGLQSLKIEISYRQRFDEHDDVVVIDGVRFASLARIINQKLLAAYDGEHPRTRARDLHDLEFLARTFPDEFDVGAAARLAAFASDPDLLLSRYKPAFVEEGLAKAETDLEGLILRLHENANTLINTFPA
jgi:predicted nucleotidyltransferase component of viral defense system